MKQMGVKGFILMAMACLCGTSAIATAGERMAAKEQIPLVIYLHAPNSPAQTVTVWVPKTPPRAVESGGALKPRVITLPAFNSPPRSVTVWVPNR